MLCHADNSEHPSREAMHKHLRKLKIKQADYYVKYEPRHCRQTSEALTFKTVEQYLAAEFKDKTALKQWLKANPTKGREWAVRWLAARKADKKLTYAPTEVELRTLFAPGMKEFEALGGYAAICAELGFKPRFDGQLVKAPLSQDVHIVVDTREQTPLKIAHRHEEGTVAIGDYALDPAHDKGVYIERKSLNDFIGTLSSRTTRPGDSNLARFTRELERAEETGTYVVMLVESEIGQAQGFNHLPHIHAKVHPDHVFKALRDLLVRFQCFQALFVAGRVEAAQAVEVILGAGESVKRVDLQYLYSSGGLL